jgi:hypothetical protein
MKKKILLSFLIASISAIGFSQSTATYSVVFESNWSQSAHPHSSGNLPGNAHWSKLVGATHNDQVTFLEMGSPATEGVKDIAELGSNTAFFAEVNTAIAAASANQIIDGPNLGTALGQMVIGAVETTDEYPMLTLASMIAPSPDWMIAVNSIELQDSFGEWKDEISIDLFPYDAGTDSGTDYTSGNAPTTPQSTISNASGTAPFSNEKIGTLTITLESILGDDVSTFQKLQVFPNPTRGNVTVTSATSIQAIEVFNVLGKRVLYNDRINNTTFNLDLEKQPSGVYLVMITDSTQNKTTKKIIKQ